MLQWFFRIIRGKEYRRAEEQSMHLEQLPIDTARSRALALLQNPGYYRCEAASETNNVKGLGPILSEFFSRYAHVEDANGGTRIGVSYIGPSPLRPNMFRIGEDVEMHFELVVRPGDDRVYWISDAIHSLDKGDATIYHTIVGDHTPESARQAPA